MAVRVGRGVAAIGRSVGLDVTAIIDGFAVAGGDGGGGSFTTPRPHLMQETLDGQLQRLPSNSVPDGHVTVLTISPPEHWKKPTQSVEGNIPVAPGGHELQGSVGAIVGELVDALEGGELIVG